MILKEWKRVKTDCSIHGASSEKAQMSVLGDMGLLGDATASFTLAVMFLILEGRSCF